MVTDTEGIRSSDDLDVDRVFVSAVCSFPERALPLLPAKLFQVENTNGPDGIVRFFFAIQVIESSTWQQRQDEFSDACRETAKAVLGAGITNPLLTQCEGTVVVHISLQPDHGQAGVILTPQIFESWRDLTVDFSVSSI